MIDKERLLGNDGCLLSELEKVNGNFLAAEHEALNTGQLGPVKNSSSLKYAVIVPQ
jgi:hypothetical protein